MAIAQAKLPLSLVHVVACKRQSLLVFGQLELEHHQVLIAKRRLGAGKIHLPHAAEPLSELFGGRMPRCAEALAPVPQRRSVVQPQDLEIRDDQTLALDRRKYLAQRRNIATRENILGNEWVSGSRPIETADRMKHRDAFVREEFADLVEEA